MSNPLVSIIVPSFNQGRFIKKTIESCLSQDYRPIEVLVIDGASTDNTLDVLHDYDSVPEVKWVSKPDSGVVEAVNKGFALANGEIGAIQSSDDAYLPNALQKAVSRLSENPDVGLVYGDCIKVDEDGHELSRFVTKHFTLENFLTKETIILQPAAFFRLKLVKELGGWDSRYFNADTELWLRMIFRTKAMKVDEFISVRHMHGEQRDHRAREIVESYWRMMDCSPDLAKASGRLRRAAQCGKYRHAYRYNPDQSYWKQTYYLWRAVFAFPPIFKQVRNRALIPGYYPARVMLSRIKRKFIGHSQLA